MGFTVCLRDNIDSGNYEWQAGGSALAGYKVDSINYDANGNILNLFRRSSTSTYMDYLTYAYNNGTNQLNQVFDQVLSGSFPDDLDNQSMDNYEYDGAGNLTDDAQAGAAISWTPYGKVKEVQRSSENQTVQYGYDAQQNRVLKKIIDTSTDGEIWTCYIRDAQGNVLAVYKKEADTIAWAEQHLYGSSRIGTLEPGVKWYTGSGTPDTPYFLDTAQLCVGWKRYEVTNHLGNVMAVISDRKSYHDTDTDGDADYFDPVFLSATDYYPFGFEMPGRKYNFGGYRYGFNGKENDTDGEFSSLTHYDYGFRIYNPAIGRFLSVDPNSEKYSDLTPYNYVANMPIRAIDPDGRDIIILGSQEYRRQVMQTLRDLYSSSPTARQAILELATSDDNFLIVAHPGKENAYTPFGTDDGTGGKEATGYLVFNIDQAGAPLDPNNGRNGKPLEQTVGSSLAHELKHMIDDLQGVSEQMAGKIIVNLNDPLVENPEYTGIPGSSEPKYLTNSILAVEPGAVDFENKVRAELFMDLRTHYGGINVFNKQVSEDWKTFGTGQRTFSTYTLLPLNNDYRAFQQIAVKRNLEEVFKANKWWDNTFQISNEPYSTFGFGRGDIPAPDSSDGATRIKY